MIRIDEVCIQKPIPASLESSEYIFKSTPQLNGLHFLFYVMFALLLFQVGYEIGAGNDKLPGHYMNDLDNELIPVIHNAASHSQEGPVTLELVFHILE